MKRFFASLFLFLYVYNLAGYLLVYSVRQATVRNEIKRILKASFPREDIIMFSFHTASLAAGDYPFQWIEENEFRYLGRMYDIVGFSSQNDTTTFLCINDIQEEALFADLNNHVSREMGDNVPRWGLDAFKDVFKESLFRPCPIGAVPSRPLIHPLPVADLYKSVVPEISTPPPRTGPATT